MLTLVDCHLMYPGTPWDKTTYNYVYIIDSHLDILHLAFWCVSFGFGLGGEGGGVHHHTK